MHLKVITALIERKSVNPSQPQILDAQNFQAHVHLHMPNILANDGQNSGTDQVMDNEKIHALGEGLIFKGIPDRWRSFPKLRRGYATIEPLC
jgi:hypothetical protein